MQMLYGIKPAPGLHPMHIFLQLETGCFWWGDPGLLRRAFCCWWELQEGWPRSPHPRGSAVFMISPL